MSLAMDMDRLWSLRKRLEDARLRSPLFDTKRWVSNFELGMQLVWSRYEQGLPPSEVDVPDTVMPDSAPDGARAASADTAMGRGAASGAGAGAGAGAKPTGASPVRQAWG